MRLYTIGFEMGALSPSDVSPVAPSRAEGAKGEGRVEREGAADARPQAEVDTESRRGFLRNVLTGAGAGAAMTYAYGRPAAASEVPELAADDPNAPEEVSSLVTEGSLGKLKLAEQVAKMIESGAITPTYAEDSREALAGAGVLAVAATEKGKGPVQRGRRGFLATVSGLLSGAILVNSADFAQAQELAFVTYNVNSNEREGGMYSEAEEKESEKRELQGMRITLEDFIRSRACESPRGARLFAQHEEIVRYNKELVLRKRARGEKVEGLQRSPIIVFSNWYHRPSKISDDAVYSFFRLRDQVLIPDSNGGHQRVQKHYGVVQALDAQTRKPHYLMWSGYLGTDKDKAEGGMEKIRGEF